jgi:hypothetical protein
MSCRTHVSVVSNAKVVVLADAMYSLNHDDFQQDGHWPLFMSWVYHNMDATGE